MPGLQWRLETSASCWHVARLLDAQCNGWVDFSGATSRYVAGERGHGRYRNCNSRKVYGICGANAEEQALHRSCCGEAERQTDQNSDKCHLHGIAYYHTEDLASVC